MLSFIKDNTFEIVSICFSAFALGISIWQSFRNRAFQLKMERPELKMGLTIVSTDRALEISIRNIGRGPAYITGWDFSARGEKWRQISWIKILECLFPGSVESFQYQEQLFTAPSVVQAFSTVVLFKFRLSDEHQWERKLNHVWRVYAHAIRLRVRYKSDLHAKEYELLADPSGDVPAPTDSFSFKPAA